MVSAIYTGGIQLLSRSLLYNLQDNGTIPIPVGGTNF